MLCCLGLFVGFAIGSTLGGPWTFIAPAIGFGLGFMGDRKLMRGSHGGHGGYEGGCCGGGHTRSKKVKKAAGDPVCGMEVNEKTAKYKAEFKGKTYYFCSSTCRSMFKKDPGGYVK
ncbi:MAG: YHS domain-containing protein [Candidatus Bathyarchaeia archaeon]